MTPHSEHYLTGDEEQTLLQIARASLEAYVRDQREIHLDEFPLTDALIERHGAFVTLRNRGHLRGCIGYTANSAPLAECVCENAVNAAARDPRFMPITPDELPNITIEISALTPGETPDTPFKRVNDISEIILGRDGLYIERPPRRGGLLLPQVPVEQGWDLVRFLAGVCRKAGYHDGAWKDKDTILYRFSAQVFSEKE
jgi:AmmeMemoRadiSam system protein A